MTLTNAETVRNATGVVSLDIGSGNAAVICVQKGKITLDGIEYVGGEGFAVPYGTDAEIVAQPYADYVILELSDLDLVGASAVDIIKDDKLELLAELVSGVVDDSEVSADFFDGATKMLLSFIDIKTDFDSLGNRHVCMAKRYIEENYGSTIKVEDIAENIGVDRKYLRNLFFKYLGVSTKDYLTNYRIEKAKEMLAANSVAVCEVASAVGYADALGFSKLFKKHVGVSPSDYRNGVTHDDVEDEDVKVYTPKKEDIKYFLL